MITALVGLAILALVVFAFVLEPVLRARPDRVELDAAAFEPATTRPTGDDELLLDSRDSAERATHERDAENRAAPPAPAVERRAVGDPS